MQRTKLVNWLAAASILGAGAIASAPAFAVKVGPVEDHGALGAQDLDAGGRVLASPERRVARHGGARAEERSLPEPARGEGDPPPRRPPDPLALEEAGPRPERPRRRHLPLDALGVGEVVVVPLADVLPGRRADGEVPELAEREPRGRVYVSGGLRFRLNLWTDLPQTHGTFESGLLNRTPLDWDYRIRSMVGARPDREVED